MAHRNDLNAARLAAFHDGMLAERCAGHEPPAPCFTEGVWHWIERNHVCNAMLWDEDELARRTDVPDPEIVCCKRNIDRHNQARLDAVDVVDALLLELFDDAASPGARLHSETPGAMIDRMSMLSLRIHHVRRQAEAANGSDVVVMRVIPTLKRLVAQRSDLSDCLDRLLLELADGQAFFRLYRSAPHRRLTQAASPF
jgi:hypothetical protein